MRPGGLSPGSVDHTPTTAARGLPPSPFPFPSPFPKHTPRRRGLRPLPRTRMAAARNASVSRAGASSSERLRRAAGTRYSPLTLSSFYMYRAKRRTCRRVYRPRHRRDDHQINPSLTRAHTAPTGPTRAQERKVAEAGGGLGEPAIGHPLMGPRHKPRSGAVPLARPLRGDGVLGMA